MERSRNAFTLIELIIAVAILGVIAMIAVPRLQYAVVYGKQADTVARKIMTDLRRARNLAITNAASNTDGFAVNMLGATPYGSYEIENLDTGEAVDTYTIDDVVSCSGGRTFEFGPLGNLKDGSDNTLTVSASDKEFTITIISATGMIQCSEN